MKPIRHRSAIHDYYAVETTTGERVWLAVPHGTPTKTVRLPKPRTRRVALAAA
jgi:hypothetical protein